MAYDISILLESNEPFITCFEFNMANGEKIFLTSSNKILEIGDKIYLPNSGLNLESFAFNDSAYNYIKLSGIFEKEGIDESKKLDGAEVSILFYFINKKQICNWIIYSFSKILHDGLKFTIFLSSEIFKLHKNILQNYSKNCRAIFGDNKCMIDKYLYSSSYDIISAECLDIRISRCNKPDGYFVDGTAIFDNSISYRIISHVGTSIKLLGKLYCDIKKQHKVILIAGCDKTISTCCNKYDNAINFRGEPFIPYR